MNQKQMERELALAERTLERLKSELWAAIPAFERLQQSVGPDPDNVCNENRVREAIGDHKQLPPTNFFKMVNAGGDDGDEDDEEIATVDRVADYESILTLARARGMAERMLAWHYRSKHPSLIALSNDECYGGRLLLPPSPFVQTAEFGLSLVQTPRGHYDRGGTSRDLIQAEQVAKVVADHIKRYPNKSLGVACLSAHSAMALRI